VRLARAACSCGSLSLNAKPKSVLKPLYAPKPLARTSLRCIAAGGTRGYEGLLDVTRTRRATPTLRGRYADATRTLRGRYADATRTLRGRYADATRKRRTAWGRRDSAISRMSVRIKSYCSGRVGTKRLGWGSGAPVSGTRRVRACGTNGRVTLPVEAWFCEHTGFGRGGVDYNIEPAHPPPSYSTGRELGTQRTQSHRTAGGTSWTRTPPKRMRRTTCGSSCWSSRST